MYNNIITFGYIYGDIEPRITDTLHIHLYIPFICIYCKDRAKTIRQVEKNEKSFYLSKIAGRSAFFRRAITSAGALEIQAQSLCTVLYCNKRARNRQKYQVKPLNLENFTWISDEF